MHTAVCKLSSISPYSQSAFYQTPKLEKESSADYEKRTWRDRCNVNGDGFIYIPPMAFKNCLASTAKYLSESIPGKGKATWTKHFLSGVLVVEPLVLPVKKDEVPGEWILVPADGIAGSGKKVMKCFPLISKWEGIVEFAVLDDTITKPVFIRHLEQAGSFRGVGRFRPEKGGYYGRFRVDSVEWK